MARVMLGQTATIAIPVTDGGSPPAAVDPATVSAVVRDLLTGLQVGSTVTFAGGGITKLGTGSYRYLLDTGAGTTITAGGSYAIEVTTTGPRGSFSTWLDVVAAVPQLISLTDAKLQLGKTSTGDDAELRFFVDAVNSRVETECGAVVPRQVSERVVADRRGRLVVSRLPVLALISATVSGVSVPTTGWQVPADGPISLPTSTYLIGPPATSLLLGTYDLVYVAGRSPVPPEIPLGARMLLQDWWKTQRSGTTLQPIGADDPAGAYLAAVAAGRAYAIPPRIASMFAGYESGVSFA